MDECVDHEPGLVEVERLEVDSHELADKACPAVAPDHISRAQHFARFRRGCNRQFYKVIKLD
jgi:hypothetical protein